MEKCILKKLNIEQQKLVEQNHSLIYSFMNKNHLSENAVEDWYGCCAEALCKAALIYDPSKKIAFSTLAYVCMSNAMKMEFRNRDKCVNADYSLQYYLGNDKNITLGDSIEDKTVQTEDEVEFYDIFYKHYNELTERQKNIINDIIHSDKNQSEVAKMYNLTRSRVSTIYSQFMNKIYSDLYESEDR